MQLALAAPRKRKEDGEDTRMPMPHHSLAAPFAHEGLLGDWSVSGASLFEGDRALVHPAVTQRSGFIWNKSPLLTNNFEVVTQFRFVGDKETTSVAKDQSLSFWYVKENISETYDESKLIQASNWTVGLQESGLTLGGFRTKFKGLGMVLSTADAQGAIKPVCSLVQNDGSLDLEYGKDVPTKASKAIDFRNTLNPAQVKFRVTPTTIEGYLKQSPSLSWNECFKVNISTPIESGGYIGFTAWSGTGPKADLVSLHQVDVYNHDTTVIGEDMGKDVSREIQEAYREMLTDKNRHFADQKSQTDHLARLTSMLQQHIETSKPLDTQLFKDLDAVANRVEGLDSDCKLLTKEIQVIIPDNGKVLSNGVRDEIIGLRRLFVKDGAAHLQKLEKAHQKVAEVKQQSGESSHAKSLVAVVESADKLEKTILAKNQQSSWVLYILIGCTLLVGVLMYFRMNYYEQKHFGGLGGGGLMGAMGGRRRSALPE